MENASKAIIIGGSVLISILIVSLGIYIYNSTKDTTGKAEEAAVSLEVQLYNQKFEKYLTGDIISPQGHKLIRGSTIRKLVSEAIASKSDIEIYTKSNRTTYGGNNENQLSELLNLIYDNSTWMLWLVFYDENGRITSIHFGD